MPRGVPNTKGREQGNAGMAIQLAEITPRDPMGRSALDTILGTLEQVSPERRLQTIAAAVCMLDEGAALAALQQWRATEFGLQEHNTGVHRQRASAEG